MYRNCGVNRSAKSPAAPNGRSPPGQVLSPGVDALPWGGCFPPGRMFLLRGRRFAGARFSSGVGALLRGRCSPPGRAFSPGEDALIRLWHRYGNVLPRGQLCPGASVLPRGRLCPDIQLLGRFRSVEGVRVLAAALRLVHRLVGLLEEVLSIGRVGSVNDTNAD